MFSSLRILLNKRRDYRRYASMTREEFEQDKLVRFRDLVRHAHEKSPYYRDLIARNGIDPGRCEPDDFPPLTKSELMANFDRISTDPAITKQSVADFLSRSSDPVERLRRKYRVIHTSGSSGEVGYFVYGPDDWARGLGMAQRPGFEVERPQRKRSGRLRIAYYGATDGHYAGVSMVAALKQNFLARLFLDVELCEVNDPLTDIIDRLNAFQPEILVGYTTALKILAAKQNEGLLRLDMLTGIMTGGEVTTANDKQIFLDAFGCGTTNTYGSSEFLAMGSAQPDSEDIVLFDDQTIYEIHDDHTLITNLFNYTMPLIRYRMADILRPLPHMSRYSPYLAIESLVGRSELQPFFRNRDGVEDFISPHTINEIFVAGVNRFQMRLTGEDRFRFLICLDPALGAADASECKSKIERRLREILDRKLMANVSFGVDIVDDLPVNPVTRKFQLIVDERGDGATPAGY